MAILLLAFILLLVAERLPVALTTPYIDIQTYLYTLAYSYTPAC
jgi:hypothetical protein